MNITWRKEQTQPKININIMGTRVHLLELPRDPVVGDAYFVGIEKKKILYVWSGSNWLIKF